MPRAVVLSPSREMAILGLVELTLSFAVIYGAVQAAVASVPLSAVAAFLPAGGIALAALLTIIIGGVALTSGLYRPDACLDGKRLLLAGGLGATIPLAVLLFIQNRPTGGVRIDSTLHIAAAITLWLAAMALIRLAYGSVTGHRSMARRVLLLGDPARVQSLDVHLQSRRGRLFDPIVHQDQDLSWPSLRQRAIWGVVVTSEPDATTADALLDCKFRGMRISSAAAFRETYLGRIDLDALTANDLLTGDDFAAGRLSAGVKRLCDIVIGGCMLIVLLPVMAITALAIKIDSHGPVFYRQSRVGRFDKTFTLLKFRSMTVDAEANGHPRWAQKQDPRITRIGRIIRATRIDELPQLANILRGEMSLVGPRPERPHFVRQLARAIPMYRQRTYVKPGLTGWAQVNFPYGASVEDAREKLAFDLYYVKNRTIVLDAIILFATIRVVLFREGAR
ncbi:MAG TPA: exopolysaccharide biosynthesis polyprenyl glycosylphosphotransferase [Rhodopila sp.]|jgi:exopolysaccharide biosynthesis polyprenyl glycosylphosphotransferase|nr:exopolysaccharide biosynthesis polyprenyl glycosylphosphotransferase [Rhodopila sp.]